jgi:Uma2 family endonuclease
MSIASQERQAIFERAFPISVEAYHLLCNNGFISERTELLEGVVIEKMPKDPIHSEVVRRVFDYLKKVKSFKILKEDPINTGFSEPEPDISVVPNGDYSIAHPREAMLVIEVANTSLALDRAKSFIYAKASIPEYIIINLQNNILEVYMTPIDGKYFFTKILQKEEIFISTIIPEISFALNGFLP